MIETLLISTPPVRYNPPDPTDEIVETWPLIQQLIDKGAQDPTTQGLIMGLINLCNAERMEQNLEIEDMVLPNQDTIKMAVERYDQVLPTMLEETPGLAVLQTGPAYNKPFNKGVLTACVAWYIVAITADEEEEEEVPAAGVAFTLVDPEGSEESEKRADNLEEGGITISEILQNLAEEGITAYVGYDSVSKRHMLTLIVAAAQLTAASLSTIQIIFGTSIFDGEPQISTSAHGLTASGPIVGGAEW